MPFRQDIKSNLERLYSYTDIINGRMIAPDKIFSGWKRLGKCQDINMEKRRNKAVEKNIPGLKTLCRFLIEFIKAGYTVGATVITVFATVLTGLATVVGSFLLMNMFFSILMHMHGRHSSFLFVMMGIKTYTNATTKTNHSIQGKYRKKYRRL